MTVAVLETAEKTTPVVETKVDVKVEELKQQKEFESKTQAKLDAVFNNSPSASTPKDEGDQTDDSEKDEDATPDDQADSSTDADDSKSDEADDSKADEDGEKKEATPPADDSTPTGAIAEIPGVYYRAAKHQKWSDEQIEKFYEKDPELCVNTLKTLHENQNNLSRQFAALGRERTKSQTAPVAAAPTEVTKPSVDMTRLKEAYGDDPIVGVIEALVKQNEALIKQAPPAAPVQPVSERDLISKQRDLDQTQKEIDSFFGESSLKPYNEFYGPKGKSWDELSQKQLDNRWSVIKMADEIIAGAASLGSELSVEEALQRAHAVVGESVREKIIREEIKNKVVKRGKGLSLAPSSSTPNTSGKPATKEEFELKTQQRLQKVFK